MSALNDFQSKNDQELLQLHCDLMEELRERQLVRSSNNPVADYAEKVAVERLGLIHASKEERGFDATDQNGIRYQIKGRRNTKHNNSRQLGVIRDLDEHLFDYVIAVIFDENLSVKEMWKIPYSYIKEKSRPSEHQHGHIFIARLSLLSGSKEVERIV
jgi:hypothetical protein